MRSRGRVTVPRLIFASTRRSRGAISQLVALPLIQPAKALVRFATVRPLGATPLDSVLGLPFVVGGAPAAQATALATILRTLGVAAAPAGTFTPTIPVEA